MSDSNALPRRLLGRQWRPRNARGRRWTAHVERFLPAVFDCATGTLVRAPR